MRWLLFPLALVVGLVALARPDGGEAGDRPVRISLSEYRIAPEQTELRAGKVRFETVNEGRIEHELLILQTDLEPEKIPLGLEGPALKLAGTLVLGTPHEHGDIVDGLLRRRHIQPGRARRDSVTLTAGNYVLLCNLPGHYEAGQRARLVVR
jgi:uncharacterized cupredoxin-like copper-binding protein